MHPALSKFLIQPLFGTHEEAEAFLEKGDPNSKRSRSADLVPLPKLAKVVDQAADAVAKPSPEDKTRDGKTLPDERDNFAGDDPHRAGADTGDDDDDADDDGNDYDNVGEWWTPEGPAASEDDYRRMVAASGEYLMTQHSSIVTSALDTVVDNITNAKDDQQKRFYSGVQSYLARYAAKGLMTGYMQKGGPGSGRHAGGGSGEHQPSFELGAKASAASDVAYAARQKAYDSGKEKDWQAAAPLHEAAAKAHEAAAQSHRENVGGSKAAAKDHDYFARNQSKLAESARTPGHKGRSD